MTDKEQDFYQTRPDPAFKREMQEVANQIGIKLREVEFPQILRADLVLEVPDKLDLSETMFDFFRKYNIVEFKSQNDQFNQRKYLLNEIRTALFLIQNEDVEFKEVLTVFILASYPTGFFTYMRKNGCLFRKDKTRPWIRWARSGGRSVAIVICRDLPLDKKYYRWLIFAPSTTQKWRDCVKMLARDHQLELLDRVRDIRPKEYRKMSRDILEILKAYPPKRQKQHKKDMLDLIKVELELFAEDDPELVTETMSDIDPKIRLAGLTSEQRLEGLDPAQLDELIRLAEERKKQSN